MGFAHGYMLPRLSPLICRLSTDNRHAEFLRHISDLLAHLLDESVD